MCSKKIKVSKREQAAAAKLAGPKEKEMQKSAGGRSRVKSGSDSGFVFAEKFTSAPNPEPVVVIPPTPSTAKATPSKPAVAARRKQLNNQGNYHCPTSVQPLTATKESHATAPAHHADDRNSSGMSWSTLASSKLPAAAICPDGDSAYTGDDDDTLLSDDDACPLCMEAMDETDQQFFPCTCGYQICLYCFNRVKEAQNNQCPACRTPYVESNYRIDSSKVSTNQQKPAESPTAPITTLQEVRPCPPKGFSLPIHVAYRLCQLFPNCARGENCDFAHSDLERETWERNRREHSHRGDVFGEHEESWMCSVCQNENFAHRVSCNRCNEPKRAMVQTMVHGSRDGSRDGSGASAPKQAAAQVAHGEHSGHLRDTSGLNSQPAAAATGSLPPSNTGERRQAPPQGFTQESPAGGASRSWSCIACTFINEDAALTHCVLCNTAREDSKPPHASQPAPQVPHGSQQTAATAPAREHPPSDAAFNLGGLPVGRDASVPTTSLETPFPPPSNQHSLPAPLPTPSAGQDAWQQAMAQQMRETSAAPPHNSAGHTVPWSDAAAARSMLTPWRTASNSNIPAADASQPQGGHPAAQCGGGGLGSNWFGESIGSFGGGGAQHAPPAAYPPHGVLPPPGMGALPAQTAAQNTMPLPPPGSDTRVAEPAASSNMYQGGMGGMPSMPPSSGMQCDAFESWLLNRAPPNADSLNHQAQQQRAQESLNPAVAHAATGADEEPAWLNAPVAAPMGSGMGSALPAFFSGAPPSAGQAVEGSVSGAANASTGVIGRAPELKRGASQDQRVEDAKAWLRSVSTLSPENIVMLAGCFDEHCIGLDNLKSGDVDKTSLKEMAPRLKMGPRCNLLRAIDELRTTRVA